MSPLFLNNIRLFEAIAVERQAFKTSKYFSLSTVMSKVPQKTSSNAMKTTTINTNTKSIDFITRFYGITN